jgi:hypothetical protein
MLLKWDKWEVTIVSLIYTDDIINVQIEMKSYKSLPQYRTTTECGGVDRHDGQLHTHKMFRHCLKKYYKKMFRYLLDMTCLNMVIVHKNKGRNLDVLISMGENLAVSYK